MQPTIPLLPNHIYHLYNRGNNRADLFTDEGNYELFLKLYTQHIFPVAETFCYCLMRNHFHLLVRVREAGLGTGADLTGGAANVGERDGLAPPVRSSAQAFSNFFNAYARSYNRSKRRTGALFERPFKRIVVDNQAYFTRLVAYIHQNPQRHGFVEDFRDWKWSSYQSFVTDKPTRVRRDEVLAWFDGREPFVAAHLQQAELIRDVGLGMEDFE